MDGDAKERQHLSADALYRLVRSTFAAVADSRSSAAAIPLGDALMAGFAVFALKAPSLLAFDDQRRNDEANLKKLFNLQHVPSDTQMRTILDDVDPQDLRPAYTDVFRQLQRGKALEPFVFFQDHYYLMALDGTSYFSSEKIHCPSCLEKKSRNGKVSYSHQMLGAALVHPDHQEVIPLCPEPIIKQDGDTKNDCERNASRRFFGHFRREHPKLPVIVVADALSANAPMIADLHAHDFRFILGIKPGSHAFLFEQMRNAAENGQAHTLTLEDADGTLHHYRWLEKASLNESNTDVLVTMIEYWEIPPKGSKAPMRHFSWVTALPVNEETAPVLVRGGRARWHIENETFNTLKNQGYHFDHNFGHGDKNLSVVFALLMMLAFLVDQTTQLCDALFQAALKHVRRKCRLWENVRAIFRYVYVTSMRQLYELMLSDYKATPPAPTPSRATDNTS
jgi:hypothetical protein